MSATQDEGLWHCCFQIQTGHSIIKMIMTAHTYHTPHTVLNMRPILGALRHILEPEHLSLRHLAMTLTEELTAGRGKNSKALLWAWQLLPLPQALSSTPLFSGGYCKISPPYYSFRETKGPSMWHLLMSQEETWSPIPSISHPHSSRRSASFQRSMLWATYAVLEALVTRFRK